MKIEDINSIKRKATPANIRREMARIGINGIEAAAILRIDPRSFRRYLQGDDTETGAKMPFPTFALLTMIEPIKG